MTNPFQTVLTNCFIKGEERSQGVYGWPDTIRLRLGRYRVTLLQDQAACMPPADGVKESCVDTTRVTIDGIREGEHERAERMAFDLAALLSFATMSQVRARWFAHGSREWAYSVVGGTMYFRPTLETRDGRNVRSFLEATWSTYRRLRRPRKLNVLVEYIVSSELPGQPLEVKVLQVLVALECLKATWAAHSGIPFKKGYFRKPPSKAGKQGEKLSLEELLHGALSEVGIRRGLRRVVKVRNAIMHGGLATCQPRTLHRYYERCHEILREYLLRLLGYSGYYHPYSQPNTLRRMGPRA